MRASPVLSEWLREAPFALALSAGFFGFFAHAGALVALEDAGLLPVRGSGASAGALVIGAWASGLDARRLADELLRVRREDFWDPRPGAGLLRGARFRQRLDAILEGASLEACRIPVALSAYDLFARRVRPFDHGAVAAAIHASCAVPFMFHPVWIGGRPYVDGGVADRAGLAGVPMNARVLSHHLSSRFPRELRPPQRPGLVAVVIEELPRPGPFRMDRGARAFEAGRRGMHRALAQRLDAGVVRIA